MQIRAKDEAAIEIRGEDGKMLVRFDHAGVLEYGESYDPDTAARIFWEALERYFPARLKATG